MANRWKGAALVCGWLAATAVAHAQGYGEPAPVGGSNCGSEHSQPMPGPLTTPYAPEGPSDSMSLPGNVANASTPPGCYGEAGDCCPVGYVSAEYLMWFVKKPRLSVPLVTSVIPGTVGTGLLGQPNTIILLDSGGLEYNPQSGGRVTAGIWFDPAHILALEGDGFLFERKPVQYSAFSTPNATTVISVPFINFTTGQPAVLPVATPFVSVGGVTVETSNQFWGAESNVVINTHGCGTCDCGLGLSFLCGFRYLDFSERTTIDTQTTPVGSTTTTFTTDQFRTRNQFYGGQIGTRFNLYACHFFLATQAKFALGGDDESTNPLGTTTIAPQGAPPTSRPAGLFAVPSNEGRFHHGRFAYAAEAEARLGYQLTPHFSVWTGYTILYWNQVLRSGQQIDPLIQVNQVPRFGATGPVPGDQFPRVLFNETSLWVQGINFGLEFIY